MNTRTLHKQLRELSPRTSSISVECLLNFLRDNYEKNWKILVSFGQILFKIPCFIRNCIEPIQTNPNNQYWNDNKPVLKIPSVLTLSNPKKSCYLEYNGIYSN